MPKVPIRSLGEGCLFKFSLEDEQENVIIKVLDKEQYITYKVVGTSFVKSSCYWYNVFVPPYEGMQLSLF